MTDPLDDWVEGLPLPNAHEAEIDRRKFDNYLLNPEHPAHQFGSKWEAFRDIGYDVFSYEGRKAAADDIIAQIRALLGQTGAYLDRANRLATRILIAGPNGRTLELIVGWQYDEGKSHPRLVTGIPRLRR